MGQRAALAVGASFSHRARSTVEVVADELGPMSALGDRYAKQGDGASLKGLGRPIEEHGELELGCWAGEDRRLIAITEF